MMTRGFRARLSINRRFILRLPFRYIVFNLYYYDASCGP